MKILLGLLIFCSQIRAETLDPKTLILTHTSLHYHSNPETIAATQRLIETNPGAVIALAQWPLATDKKWYGFPLAKINAEYFSHAGEHTLTFPKGVRHFEVTVAGGYLSACLGRTLSTLIRHFIQTDDTQELTIQMPMKAIFTGFILSNGELIPKTPYQESILDTSMDGLNLSELINHLDLNELREVFDIALFQKNTMMDISSTKFTLHLQRSGKTLLSFGSGPSKIIHLNLN